MARRPVTAVIALSLPALALFGAGAAHAADTAPTDVVVAWDTTAGTRIKVTWQDATDTPNRVRFVGDPADDVVVVPASAPDVAYLTPTPGVPTRVSVEVGDATGATSPAGLSAEFDRSAVSTPVLDSLVPTGDTFTLRWHVPAATDGTPGDPLDALPAGWPRTSVKHGCGGADEVIGDVSSFTVHAPPAPGPFEVVVRNPWGPSPTSAPATLVGTSLRATVPVTTTYAQPVRITAATLSHVPDLGCLPVEAAGPVRTLYLQSRTSADAAWVGVGSIRAADGPTDLLPTAIGTRQFRVVAGAASWPSGAVASVAAVSPAATARTLAWVRSARFLTPTVRRGAMSTAHVWVSPALDTTALLQRRTSTGWVNVKQAPMVDGVADFRITPTATSTWRWVLPTAVGPNGLSIASTATPPFTVTVS